MMSLKIHRENLTRSDLVFLEIFHYNKNVIVYILLYNQVTQRICVKLIRIFIKHKQKNHISESRNIYYLLL